MNDIFWANKDRLSDPDQLRVGQTIFLPCDQRPNPRLAFNRLAVRSNSKRPHPQDIAFQPRRGRADQFNVRLIQRVNQRHEPLCLIKIAAAKLRDIVDHHQTQLFAIANNPPAPSFVRTDQKTQTAQSRCESRMRTHALVRNYKFWPTKR